MKILLYSVTHLQYVTFIIQLIAVGWEYYAYHFSCKQYCWLIETKFPQYADRIKVIDCWTPATYAHRDNCYKGAYMRFITTATNRNAFLSSGIRGLRNVVLASHWLRYPGGVPTAAAMGRHAVRIIEKINGE